MSRGLPDDANVKGYGDIHRSDDITELAARLGVPLTYERRGNVLHIEDFRLGAANWIVERESTPETPTLSASYHVSGGTALVLANEAGEAETVVASRTMPLFSPARYGLFIMVSLSSGANQFAIDAYHYDGTDMRTYELKLSANAETGGYLGSDGNPVSLTTGLNFFTGEGHFHALGLVFDTSENTWVQVTIDGTTYDLEDVDPRSVGAVTAPRLQLDLTIVATPTIDVVAIVDSVILVQNPTILS